MSNLINEIKDKFNYFVNNFDNFIDSADAKTFLKLDKSFKRVNVEYFDNIQTISYFNDSTYILMNGSSITLFGEQNMKEISLFAGYKLIYSNKYNEIFLHSLFDSVDDITIDNIFYLKLKNEL